MFNGLPLYSIALSDENEIFGVSLVDEPAMDVNFMAFNKEEEKIEMMKFSVTNEMEHNILCCVVRADFPILRTYNGAYFYITIPKGVCKQLCQKLMKDGYQQNVSVNHNGENIDGYHLQELFLKDSQRGISPKGFDEVAEGSLFGIYHIDDEDIWNKCLDGTFNGISMESDLIINFSEYNKIKKEEESMKKSIKQQIFELLQKFNSIVTDKIEIFYDDEELVIGSLVYDEDKNPIADGEYLYEDKTYVVKDGKIEDIVATEEKKEEVIEEIIEEGVEVNAEEDVIEETVEEVIVDEKDAKIAELEKLIAELKEELEKKDAEIAGLKEALEAPATESVVEEFDKIATPSKKMSKALEIASAFKR